MLAPSTISNNRIRRIGCDKIIPPDSHSDEGGFVVLRQGGANLFAVINNISFIIFIGGYMKRTVHCVQQSLAIVILLCFVIAVQMQGQTTQCASFNGNDTSSISLGRYALHALTTNLTLEAWIKPSSSTAYASILGNIWWTSQNVGGYAMWMAGGSDPYYVGFGIADENTAAEINTAQIPGLNQWIHLACTYDGAKMVIYVNGDTAASLTHSGDIVYDNYTDLFIGKYHDDTELYCYSGLIDEVRLWNVVRTQSQLQQYDSTELVGNEAGLLGYWKLNEGSGSITQDGTINNKDGTLYNVTWVGETGMPVELMSFTAAAGMGEVELAWKTATEVNNHGFDIERSETGSGRRGNWTTIGFVEGNGTTNTSKQYTYIDKTPSSGTYYYRLKQIDRDGKFEYSNQIEITVGAPKELSLLQNYPNPFNPATTITYQLPTNGLTTLTVYDGLGREAAILVNEVKEAGTYSTVFNASRLSSGVYFARLQNGETIQLKAMLLMK